MTFLRGKRLRTELDLTGPDLTAFSQKIQSIYLQESSAEVASKHISMMMAEVAKPSIGSFKVPLGRRLRNSLTFRVAAVTTLFIGATGGLAYAGVLPDAMQDAVSSAAAKAGFDLPVGDPDSSASAGADTAKTDSDLSNSVRDDVLDAVRSEYDSGRDKGDAVSDAASQNRKDQALPNGRGVDVAATDDPPASGRPDDPQDQGPRKP